MEGMNIFPFLGIGQFPQMWNKAKIALREVHVGYLQ
jgi:hypothetical protein